MPVLVLASPVLPFPPPDEEEIAVGVAGLAARGKVERKDGVGMASAVEKLPVEREEYHVGGIRRLSQPEEGEKPRAPVPFVAGDLAEQVEEPAGAVLVGGGVVLAGEEMKQRPVIVDRSGAEIDQGPGNLQVFGARLLVHGMVDQWPGLHGGLLRRLER